jgi:hypothetical protein
MTHLLRDPSGLLILMLGAVGRLAFRREDDACQRITPAKGVSADLVSSPREPSHIVQPGGGIQETLLSERIHFTLSLEESGKLQEQSFAINRLPQELPCPGAVRLEALSTAGGPRSGDDDGCIGAETGITPKLPTHLEAMQVRHLCIEDDDVWLGSTNPLQGLLSGVGAYYGVAAGSEDAFE